jgi:hypothetical protein
MRIERGLSTHVSLLRQHLKIDSIEDVLSDCELDVIALLSLEKLVLGIVTQAAGLFSIRA